MPEKNLSSERMLSKMPEKEKQAVLREMMEEFAGYDFELKLARGLAREKTPDEMKIIDLVNKRGNEVLARYGLPESSVSPDNVYVLCGEDWRWGDENDALCMPALRAVVMRDFCSNVKFAVTTLHETFHFKSYSALQLTIGGGEIPSVYRAGLTVANRFIKEEYLRKRYSKTGKRYFARYFSNLNEAVTEELAKRFICDPSVRENPLFKDEFAETERLRRKYGESARYESGEKFFIEDVYWATIEKGELRGKRFVYSQERRILNTLIDRLFEINKEKFESRERVFDVFAKAMFSGNILPVGRLIDGSFGKGTFRKIGELDDSLNQQEEFVNAL
ncbi:MAG: hypothetical protein HY813_03625 [Candidatus Portnoybacteria bacterium]|nr:hypothetical protein [Candidatus Portnoybacteria bacterium]